ncbi:MAG: hypothetical protein K8F91_18165, partial [Candidatus Obscuribacterales bacterium]|nr:hypothetical protein [Candidatus Obscuribacterales bacterium]
IVLPFRLSFGHSLASRNNSENVLVKVVVEDASGNRYDGYGESVPRDYVTGETIDGALKAIREEYIPRLTGKYFDTPLSVLVFLKETFEELELTHRPRGASWCAVELAVMDAVARANYLSFAALLSIWNVTTKQDQFQVASIQSFVQYGGVIPFGGTFTWAAILLFFKYFGFQTVKMKVGLDWQKDEFKLKIARSILGKDVVLRVDANCAWTVDETLYFAEKMRKYKVSSIEQPVAPENLEGMKKLTAELPETVVADESLCTLVQARQLVSERACDAFNIRLSKVGGPLIACQIADLAQANGVGVMLGAQVGESALLSSAGRSWAAVKGPFDNCEGSFNRFLLRHDLTRQDVTFRKGGVAPVLPLPGRGYGLGVEVDEHLLKRCLSRKESGAATMTLEERDPVRLESG